MSNNLISLSSSVVKVHPVVLLSILDHHTRRNADVSRVVGTLLGSVGSDGVIDVKNSFAVPHTETEDDIRLDLTVMQSFLELHARVNPRESVVGWYSTSLDDSNDSKVHSHFASLCPSPLHLVVDASLSVNSIPTRGFLARNMAVGGRSLGLFFEEVAVETKAYEAERIGVDFITKGDVANGGGGDEAGAVGGGGGSALLSSNLDSLHVSLERLVQLLDKAVDYTGKVSSKKIPADNAVGRFLAATIAGIPAVDAKKMGEITEKSMEDLLMVVYLSSLARTQLALAQKLSGAI